MANALLYEKAASCYYQARLMADAVRCYRLAGAHRRAADLSVSLGEFREAAADYAQCGMQELAAWLLVHRAEDPQAARAMITELAPVAAPGSSSRQRSAAPELSPRQRLVLARCDIADGTTLAAVLAVLDDVCAELAEPAVPYDRVVEEWAVAVAEQAGRFDQVALVFAASVRGMRRGAGQRWADWARRVLGTEITIPALAGPDARAVAR
ncbi:MAG TPA: hypothetical protein VFQ44_11900 [Streptosporangiaceae bacterium]|nr:hypothetical protein [Streptosporangiaceae bacterium]